MGANLSRRLAAELSSYETSVQRDPELQSMDAAIHQRATRAISTIAAGIELRSLSFDSLRELVAILIDMNQDAVKVILECNGDINNNDELLKLVKDYFNCSNDTVEFCNSLEKCLNKARESQSIIQEALRRFSEEDDDIKYAKTLEELKLFKAAGNPFGEEFARKFRTVYRQQKSMLEKLLSRKEKLEARIRNIKGWRKVSSVIFVVTFVAVLVCSVVAAAIAAPPVASILAATAAIPIGSAGKWVDSLFKKYQDVVKEKGVMVSSMWVGSGIAIIDLDTIKALVDNFENRISLFLDKAEFALRDDEAVKIAMEDIRGKMEVLVKGIDDLAEQANKFSGAIGSARAAVLRRIGRRLS